jgi:hypothetical protein
VSKCLQWNEKIYQVYALIDPRDNPVRYIGKSGDVQQRYDQHLHIVGGGWQERKWIIELGNLGLKPILSTDCYKYEAPLLNTTGAFVDFCGDACDTGHRRSLPSSGSAGL